MILGASFLQPPWVQITRVILPAGAHSPSSPAEDLGRIQWSGVRLLLQRLRVRSLVRSCQPARMHSKLMKITP